MDMFSIWYNTRVSLGVPGIILNSAEPIPEFLQELSTELPQLAQVLIVVNLIFLFFKRKNSFKNKGRVECDVNTYFRNKC